jgi:hypothetical protein
MYPINKKSQNSEKLSSLLQMVKGFSLNLFRKVSSMGHRLWNKGVGYWRKRRKSKIDLLDNVTSIRPKKNTIFNFSQISKVNVPKYVIEKNDDGNGDNGVIDALSGENTFCRVF